MSNPVCLAVPGLDRAGGETRTDGHVGVENVGQEILRAPMCDSGKVGAHPVSHGNPRRGSARRSPGKGFCHARRRRKRGRRESQSETTDLRLLYSSSPKNRLARSRMPEEPRRSRRRCSRSRLSSTVRVPPPAPTPEGRDEAPLQKQCEQGRSNGRADGAPAGQGGPRSASRKDASEARAAPWISSGSRASRHFKRTLVALAVGPMASIRMAATRAVTDSVVVPAARRAWDREASGKEKREFPGPGSAPRAPG